MHATNTKTATSANGKDDDGAWFRDVSARVSEAFAWPSENEKHVLEPYAYLEQLPGKEFRSKLLDAFRVWLDVPENALEQIKGMVRRLHNASLMMDDVEDQSEIRRGAPSAHEVFGIAQTINTANYVYFQVLANMAQLEPRALPELIHELGWLHRGQGMELYWREHAECPTEEAYVDMVIHKTGGLFRVALCMMHNIVPVHVVCASGSASDDAGSYPAAERTADTVPVLPQTLGTSRSVLHTELVPLANLLGLLFQIRDDYLNLRSTQLNKGFCDDLTEGKFSFPIIHAVRAAGTDSTLMNILAQHTKDPAAKTRAVEYMNQVTHSFEYTREVWSCLHSQARDKVERIERSFGANEPMHRVLDVLGRLT